eukprot:gene10932-12154_t
MTGCALSWSGLPTFLLREYAKHGITTLFPWQVDCLASEGGKAVYQGQKNLIFTAPTSGGKTLLAEILMLKRMAGTLTLGPPNERVLRKTVFFIVPFIALAEEKAVYLRSVWKSMNIRVKTFHGPETSLIAGGSELTEDVEVAICTIERANILFNQLLSEGREKQVSMVVIDELHLLGDASRGFLLEIFITKLKYLCHLVGGGGGGGGGGGEGSVEGVQVIGMSATLPNIDQVANWLNAELYITTFRPIELRTLVCRERKLYHYSPPPPAPAPPPATTTSAPILSRSSQYTVDYSEQLMDIYGEESNHSNSNGSYPLPLSSSNTNTTTTAFYSTTSSASGSSSLLQEVLGSWKKSTHTVDVYSLPGTTSNTTLTHNSSVTTITQQKTSSVVGSSNSSSAPCWKFVRDLPPPPPPANSTSSSSSGSILPEPTTTTTTEEEKDSDGLQALCLDYVLHQHKNLLIFCPSKRRCEVTAHTLTRAFYTTTTTSTSRMVYEERQRLLDDLIEASSCAICPILSSAILYGIAYHHAGLAQEERLLIERGFRQGVLQMLCTTSTLSAGVNLPAQVVVIRSLKMGDSLLSVATFRQMCGRAGRMGQQQQQQQQGCSNTRGRGWSASGGGGGGGSGSGGSEVGQIGEAIVMLPPPRSGSSSGSEGHLHHLLTADLDPLHSALSTTTTTTLNTTLTTTSHGRGRGIGQGSNNNRGLASTCSGLSPQDALDILPLLQQGHHKIVLGSALHLIYLVIPPNAMRTIEPDWSTYELAIDKLLRDHPEGEKVMTVLGIDRAQLCSFRFHRHPLATTALGVKSRGQLQQLQREASTYCGMVIVFCQRLNWTLLATCLEEIALRLAYGVQRELLPLVRIDSELLSVARARVLYRHEIRSAKDLITVGVERIAEVLMKALPYQFRDVLVMMKKDGGGGGGGGGGGSSGKREYEACLRLAVCIVKRAEDYLQQEMRRRATTTTSTSTSSSSMLHHHR